MLDTEISTLETPELRNGQIAEAAVQMKNGAEQIGVDGCISTDLPTNVKMFDRDSMRAQNLQSALYWAKLGFKVIPIRPTDKRPLRKWCYATSDEAEVRRLWSRHPDGLVGIITGPSDLVVLDYDKKNGGLETFNQHMALYPEMSKTYIEETRSGGRHVYFLRGGLNVTSGNHIFTKTHKGVVSNRIEDRDWPGVDLKAVGGLIVAANSIDEKGEYKALNDNHIQPLPESIKEMLRKIGRLLDEEAFDQEERDPVYSNVEAMPIRTRYYCDKHSPPCIKTIISELQAGKADHSSRFALGCYLAGLHLDKGSIMAVFSAAPDFNPDITEQQVDCIFDKGYKCLRCATMDAEGLCPSTEGCNGEKSPAWNYRNNYYVKSWPFDAAKDDTGISEMLAYLDGEDIRYVRGTKRWFLWNGQFWPEDVEAACLSQKITDMADVLIDRVLYLSSMTKTLEGTAKEAHAAKVKNQYGQYRYMRSSGGLSSIINVASKVVGTFALDGIDELDKDKNMVNLLNGVINLDTGEFIPHGERTKPFLMTMQENVAYDPQATCPTYDRFIDEITCGDKALAEYIQKWAGYCLSGDTREQLFMVFKGAGANGKSVLVEVWHDIMGDYAATASSTAFTNSRGGNNGRFSFGRLRSIRLLVCSEVAEGQTWNTEKLKSFTGGERINAEEKHMPEFEYTPQAKVTFLFNHVPTARKDRAMERRLRIVPFNLNVDLDKLDKNLKAKLLEEKAGIFNWMLEGYRKWKTEGFIEPAAVINATEEHWQESDYIAAFLADRCDIGKGESFWCLPERLYDDYRVWQVSHEAEFLSPNTFARKLNSLGFKLATRYSDTEKDENGKLKQYRVRVGLRLKPPQTVTCADIKETIRAING
ncbi:phage/plasmid primase, P4 family [Methanocella sp. MCL-LM]|uniref:phage/plasmid primase, P4 family n=1 Tax=Methanocella sp. MCL-LM TaxID=3412035 RepID=UPI003C76297E